MCERIKSECLRRDSCRMNLSMENTGIALFSIYAYILMLNNFTVFSENLKFHRVDPAPTYFSDFSKFVPMFFNISVKMPFLL